MTNGQVVGRLQTRQSKTEIARQFSIDYRAGFHAFGQRLLSSQTGSAQDRPRSGRQRTTIPVHDQYIREHQRTVTTATTTVDCIIGLRRILIQTVSNRLRQHQEDLFLDQF